MKSLLAVFIFTVAVCQVFDIYAAGESKFGRKLNITVFYETLSVKDKSLYKQLKDLVHDSVLKNHVQDVTLVPFGNAYFTEFPWGITCENGPEECYGNMMNACFFAKTSDFVKNVDFLSCIMDDIYPPHAGDICAKKLGFDFKGVNECANSKEGFNLHSKNGRKTMNFKPPITSFPKVHVTGGLTAAAERQAVTDLKKVITDALSSAGGKF